MSDAGDRRAVIEAAAKINGSELEAEHWFASCEIAEFGGATALQLVDEGKAQAVLKYIESISAGAAG